MTGKCPRCRRSLHQPVEACINCGADLRPMPLQGWARLIAFVLLTAVLTWLSIHNRAA